MIKMRDSIDMSLVFKLTSVKDLGRLHKALDTALTLQQEVKLKGDVMKLEGAKRRLEHELEGLKAEINVLCPGKNIKLNKSDDDEKKEEEDTEVEEFEPEPAEQEAEMPQPDVAQDERTEGPSYIPEETDETRTL